MSPLLNCSIKIAFNPLIASPYRVLSVELENYITIVQAFDIIVQKPKLNKCYCYLHLSYSPG